MNDMWEQWAWDDSINPIWLAREDMRRNPSTILWAIQMDRIGRRRPNEQYKSCPNYRQMRDDFTEQLGRVEFAKNDYDLAKERRYQ